MKTVGTTSNSPDPQPSAKWEEFHLNPWPSCHHAGFNLFLACIIQVMPKIHTLLLLLNPTGITDRVIPQYSEEQKCN